MMLRHVPKRSYEPEISLMMADLTRDQSKRTLCPVCKGGNSGEKSFVYSRDSGGTGYYICFRASCGVRGQVGGIGPAQPDDHPASKPIAFNRVLQPLTPYQREYFVGKFGYTPGRDMFYCNEMGMFAHKIMGPLGEHRGWILKSYGAYPQSLSYPSTNDPWQGWFSPNVTVPEREDRIDKTGVVLIVEDVNSARKVSDAGFDSVALLGTNLNWDKAMEIAEWSRDVILALDKGTMAVMQGYRERYSTLFDQVTIWSLEEDLKYVTRRRIREGVLNGRTDFVTEP